MIFADPPYFLSNGGVTCHAGRMVKVDKGAWDKTQGIKLNHEFNTGWLSRCQSALKPDGTIWITGTQHVIFSIGHAMQELPLCAYAFGRSKLRHDKLIGTILKSATRE